MVKIGCGQGISPELIALLVKEANASSIVLFGSQAREDEDEFSDVDLLVVSNLTVEANEISCSRRLRSKIPKALLPKNRWLSLMVYSQDEFERMYCRGSLFVAHILWEGVVLYDDGFYGKLRQNTFCLSIEELQLSLKILYERLTIADDLSKFNDYYIRCLSNFFLISKNLAIIGLALRGKLIFNKRHAFDELAKLYPSHRDALNRLFQLKPFFVRNAKGIDVALPFEPYSCNKKIEELRDDLKQLIVEVAED